MRSSLVSLALVAGLASGQGLLPTLYEHVPTGAVKPSGWAYNQAKIQAEGLAGVTRDWYSYVAGSKWVGGTVEYSGMNEAAPYWFNGVVGLAFQLQDQKLIAQAKGFLDTLINTQQSDGWIGPEKPKADGTPRLVWPRYLVLMGMVQYAEASPADTTRIVDSIHKFLVLVRRLWLDNKYGLPGSSPEFEYQFVRWEELIYSLQWVYDYHPRGKEAELLETMREVKQKGWDWQNLWFTPSAFPKTAVTGGFNPGTHGVNIAEALKSEALSYRFTKKQADIQSTIDRVEMLYKYHGRATGTFAADEHLAGLNPSRGTELCAVVEQMFSLALIYQSFGDNSIADRVEQLAYNAFPATMMHDWWSHQYDQQVNQVWSRNMPKEKPFLVNSGYSNVFGLEPNYPCCTTNFPQAFPKFWANSFVSDNAGTLLVHAFLGPATYAGKLKGGSQVQVKVDTAYPFGSTLNYTIKTDKPFTFAVRVPAWASVPGSKSTISTYKGSNIPLSPSAKDNLYRLSISKGTIEVIVTLDMNVRIEKRSNGAIAVHRGVLNYAVEIPYSDKKSSAWRNPQALGYVKTLPNVPANYTTAYDSNGHDHVLLPTSDWQIAIDPSTIKVVDSGAQVGYYAWAPGSTPVSLTAKGCVISWAVALDSAAAPPTSPNKCVGPVKDFKLVPYGVAKLRIGEIPTVVI